MSNSEHAGRQPTPASVELDGRRYGYDQARALSLARPQRFDPGAPAWFGAPPASARALQVGAFSGSVVQGASCNCSTISLTPHADGTHTECVGHLSRERLDAIDVIPSTLLRARLLSVAPSAAALSAESTTPAPQPADRLITRAAVLAAWPDDEGLGVVRALILRTGFDARARALPPYLSAELAAWLVAREIEHLVIDLPSIDRLHDGGQLRAHRLFFGLPQGATALASATRAHCTITELAEIGAHLSDGEYLLQLQAPALGGDAVPSRPLLYRLLSP